MNQSDDRPTFTVIMPVYNHAAYLEEAVRSVVAQTRRDWELIIVDDGSTDGSAALVDRLAEGDSRITVIHQANTGPAAARNAALAKTRGAWLTYLDSDDLWFPDTLENYAARFEADQNVKFIFGYRHRLNEDGTITELEPSVSKPQADTADLFQRMFLSHLCVCYRRELLEQAGGAYDTTLPVAEDYELYLRISLNCPLHSLGKPTGLRRRHATNISMVTGFSRTVEGNVLRRFVEHQGGKAVLSEAMIRRRLGQIYYTSARNYLCQRCCKQAAQAAAEGHRYTRTIKSTLVAIIATILSPIGKTDPRKVPTL